MCKISENLKSELEKQKENEHKVEQTNQINSSSEINWAQYRKMKSMIQSGNIIIRHGDCQMGSLSINSNGNGQSMIKFTKCLLVQDNNQKTQMNCVYISDNLSIYFDEHIDRLGSSITDDKKCKILGLVIGKTYFYVETAN